MKTHRTLSAFMLIAAALFSPGLAHAQSASQQALSQYISTLQSNPKDQMLREKIIKHVQAMKKAPAIPEEAERFMARGAAAVRSAKDANDFKDAVAEFEKATLTAPWLASAYYNLGISQEKAGMYADAIRSLRLYLLASPDAPDAKAVRNLIYEIEYRQEKAAKESSPEALAVKKQKEYEEWIRKLDGATYGGPSNAGNDLAFDNEFVIHGNMLIWKQRVTYYGPAIVQEVPLGQWYDMVQYGGQMQIVGREAKRILPGVGFVNDIFTISEDGNSITQVQQVSNGHTFTFYRK
jgi:tetratricopeptide (TPR) repeat protein